MIQTIHINETNISDALKQDYLLATDIADYLVKKGMPFRQAHSIIHKLSLYAIGQAKNFKDLSLNEYHEFSALFDKDIYSICLESSVASRNATGGTAPQRVQEEICRCRKLLSDEIK